MDLTSVQDFLGLNSSDDALDFLDYASECGFIPLKAHIFQEQFYGIWACCNPECSGKQNALLTEEWKYGKVFFDLQKIQKRVVQDSERTVSMYACPYCGHNVFLTVNCQNCGEIYLAAQAEDVENGNYNFAMSILKSADGNPESTERHTFTYSNPLAGVGRFIHTYMGNGNPLPSFEGEPEKVEIKGTIDEFANMIWSSLNEENKVSLFVRFIDIATGKYEEKIINKNK